MTEKVAEAIKDLAPNAAKTLEQAQTAEDAAAKQLEQAAAEPGEASKPEAQQAAKDADNAAAQLTKASAQIRQDIQAAAKKLISGVYRAGLDNLASVME